MAQYLVVARDGTDSEAPNRRLAARSAHLENAKALVQAGKIISGGAILDDAGAMIGSAMMVDFADRDELNTWLETDPYTTGNVWQTFEVTPMRLV